MTRCIRSLSGLLATTLLLAGCAAGEGTTASTERWSTRAASVVAMDVTTPTLNVEPARVLDAEHAAGLREAALQLLGQAAEAPDPLVRANAIEALHHAPSHLADIVRRGLADPNRGVRFVAAMTVGTHELRDLAPLVDPLRLDDSASVRAAAIFALRRCGRGVDPSPLAAMLRSGDPEVRGNAAIVLGELGNRSAVPLLRDAARRRDDRVTTARARVVELQIAEALVRLGQTGEIEAIRAALFSPGPQGEIRALAALLLGRLEDRQYLYTLRDIAVRDGERRESAEVRMAAVMGVARLDRDAAPAEVAREYAFHEMAGLRAQAALTLGAAGSDADTGVLRELLGDPSPLVQVAAAGAILEIAARVR